MMALDNVVMTIPTILTVGSEEGRFLRGIVNMCVIVPHDIVMVLVIPTPGSIRESDFTGNHLSKGLPKVLREKCVENRIDARVHVA